MVELSLKERKELSLEILQYIKKVCEDNCIHYYLAYGTLLGSVRHRGFIPWDDDIDIWVPFDEYRSLMNILSNSKRYELLDFTSGDKWKGYFSKLSDPSTTIVDNSNNCSIKRGVSVDIFPLYNYDRSSLKSSKMNKYVGKLKMISNYYNKQYASFAKRLYCRTMLLFFWDYNKIIRELFALNDKLSSSNSLACLGSIYNSKDRYDKEWFNSFKEMPFENCFFVVPNNYESVLTKLYGDYNQLPPVNLRVSNHNVKAYRL